MILRSIGQLRKIYHFYSVLGHRTAEDNTFVLDRFQVRFSEDLIKSDGGFFLNFLALENVQGLRFSSGQNDSFGNRPSHRYSIN